VSTAIPHAPATKYTIRANVTGLRTARSRLHRSPDRGEVVITVPNSVILEHELAAQRSIGVQRHRRGPGESSSLSALMAAAAAALLLRSRSSAASLVTASFSLE